MTTLALRLLAFRHADELLNLITAQKDMIEAQTRLRQHEQLDHAREIQGMVAGWLLSLEQPELDIRGDLVDLEHKLRNQIATLEEHIL